MVEIGVYWISKQHTQQHTNNNSNNNKKQNNIISHLFHTAVTKSKLKQKQTKNKMGKLTVTLDRLKNLKDTDGAMNHPDPYVIFELEKNNWGPMDKKYGKQTSSTKKCTCNPKYDEKFVFEDVELNNLELSLKVYDKDWGRDDHLGQKTIKLEDALTPGEEKEFDEELDKDHKGFLSRDARIILKITFEE